MAMEDIIREKVMELLSFLEDSPEIFIDNFRLTISDRDEMGRIYSGDLNVYTSRLEARKVTTFNIVIDGNITKKTH